MFFKTFNLDSKIIDKFANLLAAITGIYTKLYIAIQFCMILTISVPGLLKLVSYRLKEHVAKALRQASGVNYHRGK